MPSMCLEQFLSSSPLPATTINVQEVVTALCSRSAKGEIKDTAEAFNVLSQLVTIYRTENDTEIDALFAPAADDLTAEHARFIATLLFRNLSAGLEYSKTGKDYTLDLNQSSTALQMHSTKLQTCGSRPWPLRGSTLGGGLMRLWAKASILQYALERVDSNMYGSSKVRDLDHCMDDIKMVALFFGDSFIGGREGTYKNGLKDTHCEA